MSESETTTGIPEVPEDNIAHGLAKILTTLADQHTAEMKKTDSYKEMFKAGKTFEGLLRTVEHQGQKPMFAAVRILKDKHGIKATDEIIDFILAVPLLARTMRRRITNMEGGCCSVDKVFYLLADQLLQVIDIGQEAQEKEPSDANQA